ncbi:hypothetical protein L3X38_005351 [Prunus dulcis]|uniref:Leucine-rich repeat-containing N-terminal plant-type domain-containing protein n=1 Tax=Prunus dulcis TaxID=3755 RepID=A0AAD5F451_PRUDU|nr:hypothetical protein L3X38_005351 [Prunus dulcis]
MAFKSKSDTSKRLINWNYSTPLCSWFGVLCNPNHRVWSLDLVNLSLHGSFEPLALLDDLLVLNLNGNRLSGPIPNLSNLTRLQILILSHNQLSGDFPITITKLYDLQRVDLSYNKLSGEIPWKVNHLTKLLTLKLDVNRFSGSIYFLRLPNLVEFNVSSNLFSGKVPGSLSSFPESCFSQNNDLCLKNCDQNISPNLNQHEREVSTVSVVSGIIGTIIVCFLILYYYLFWNVCFRLC